MKKIEDGNNALLFYLLQPVPWLGKEVSLASSEGRNQPWGGGVTIKSEDRRVLYAFLRLWEESIGEKPTVLFGCYERSLTRPLRKIRMIMEDKKDIGDDRSQQVAEVQGKHNLDTGKREFSRYDTFLEVY